jgi:hypothetical protein
MVEAAMMSDTMSVDMTVIDIDMTIHIGIMITDISVIGMSIVIVPMLVM